MKMFENIKNNAVMLTAGVFAMLLIASLLIFGPLLVVWSLNTLFPVLAISYTFESWAAVVFLFWFFRLKISAKG
jgi:hypothetical protein